MADVLYCIRIWLSLFVFSTYVYNTGSLVCYQCNDSTNKGDCRTDIDGMSDQFYQFMYPHNVSYPPPFDANRLTYLKQCSYGKYCIIEDISQNGNTIMYTRGCSSGNDTLPNAAFSIPKKNIVADNTTVCGISLTGNGMDVCVRLCDADLCNGPQVDRPVNTAAHQRYHLTTGLLMIVIYTITVTIVIS